MKTFGETDDYVIQVDQKLKDAQLRLGFIVKRVLGAGNNGTTMLAFD